ncbi:glycerate kinase [Bacillus tianshenii]|nr:glycerate kinase [Bacillus tianshenii]
MKVVIAPDSFKESLTALEVAQCMEDGFKEVFPNAEYVKVPLADGGEGTVQSLVDATAGKIRTAIVTGPLGEKVSAFYGMLGDGKTAVIEMAAASGLHHVHESERNPLKTTTFGTGELLLDAVREGAEHVIIGLGGSATNDGGAGMAQALGVRLLNASGEEIGYGGGALSELASIDRTNLNPLFHNVTIEVACDVDNPLTGPKGASYVYGPQKGATESMMQTLDENLTHFAEIVSRDIGRNVRDVKGAGAAGGLGAGLLAFLPCELRRGIDIVFEAVELEEKLSGADFVITGEGRIDHQTIYGKTPIGVAKAAKKYQLPVICIAGSIGDGSEVVYEHGIDTLFSVVNRPGTLQGALDHAKENIKSTTSNVARLMKLAIHT